MTREDTIRLAREMAAAGMITTGSVPAVALALAKAFNLGVETVAADMDNWHVKIRGEKVALYGVASGVRQKKLSEAI